MFYSDLIVVTFSSNNSTFFHKLLSWRAFPRSLPKAHWDKLLKLSCINLGNRFIISSLHILIKIIEILPIKRRFRTAHLIDNTPKWPNIRLRSIGLISPYLRTSIKRSSSLCFYQSLLAIINLGHIEITKLVHSITYEDISAFEISMKYWIFMKNS